MTGEKVLIVEDDLDLLRGLNVRLRANGYNVVAATDGISAISVTRKEEPDVIILDLGLPAGDGFSVMERLKSLIPLAHIPVIVLTGRDPLGNQERALTAGAQAFLQKPVDNDVLLGAIRKALGENRRLTQNKNGKQSTKETAQMTGKKVLIVDDDSDLLRGLNVRLRANGYSVVAATDGISAISVTRREEPDVIILDLGLPAGDGFSVMERLKSLIPLAHIPVIVITGRDPLGNLERALTAGAQAFLQKPVDNDVLLEAIRKALGENNGRE